MHQSPALFVLVLVATAAATWSSFFLVAYARQLEPVHAAGESCIGRERDALLIFKQGINDTDGFLKSWQPRRQDCCRWAGITCSNKTGHVIQLDLGGTYLMGQISPSLLSLEQLEYLNLKSTSLTGHNGGIPKFLGSFKNLRHLDLSDMYFTMAPPQLGNLSKLEYLDLSNSRRMYYSDISWLTRLPLLLHLDMSETNLSSIADWPLVVNMLPSLQYLGLFGCSLPSANQSLTHLNLTNLQHLGLSNNNFGHPIASAWFWNVRSITELYLCQTSLYGPFPDSLGNMTSLQVLYFGCHLEYVYPATTTCNAATMTVDMRNLCDLEYLRLDGSLSSGNITKFLENLPQCPSNRLKYLSMQSTNMVGIIADGLGQLTSLTSLVLSYNNITGSIPLSIGNLSHLEYLDFSNNHLTSIPQELANCTSLQNIYLSNNNLVGPIQLGIGSSTRLQSLDLSYNSITRLIPPGIGSYIRLEHLDLSYNHLTGPIAPWLGNFTRLYYITLSNNLLTGNIPPELGNATNLEFISLSNNHLSGPIPLEIASCTGLGYLSLANNHLTGHVPSKIGMLTNLVELDLNNNNLDGGITEEHLATLKSLRHMDLSNNSFSGPLPSEYGALGLIELTLSFNYFSGHIPESIFCKLRSLLVLDLSHNLLEGELPRCSQKLNLVFLHLSNNGFSGKFPSALQNYTSLSFMDLSKNNLYGELPLWIGDLVYLRFLQLSHNFLSGDIPVTITNLKRLRQLSLAGNSMSGIMPWSLSNLTSMTQKHPRRPGVDMYVWYTSYVGKFREVWPVVMKRQELKYGLGVFDVVGIDLSLNQLVGEIPDGITSLNGLLNLNLSCNQLSGEIPAKIGLMKSIESLDLSRNNLSGGIPTSLSDLTYLSFLDLSYNNLEGRIPPGSQLDTLYMENPSIYTGNIGLCGHPLERNCSGDNTLEHVNQHRREKVSEPVLFFYFGLGSLFLVGLWVVFCTLLFKKAWRVAYFRLFDKVYDNAYVFVVVTLGRMKGKATS
ncbi:LRR receptor-like serine/threonine-protein kinase GSO1 [Lolium rigidum]|uniref:LRR receptor-like serine/threonine-protein kinase GSO1 n=1 Tax=Lolium rigidum TaxID=89674 RepID=UPI001F5E30A1|nr:LRR receptor-like serine/threonine-protein kinase GSO1 [Lolium rigidum]